MGTKGEKKHKTKGAKTNGAEERRCMCDEAVMSGTGRENESAASSLRTDVSLRLIFPLKSLFFCSCPRQVISCPPSSQKDPFHCSRNVRPVTRFDKRR